MSFFLNLLLAFLASIGVASETPAPEAPAPEIGTAVVQEAGSEVEEREFIIVGEHTFEVHEHVTVN